MSDGFAPFEGVRYWKSRPAGARFPLSSSAVPEAALADVDPTGEAATKIGASALGASLGLWRERIAARYRVPADHAYSAFATSGATFLALSALDSKLPKSAAVAVERPAYGIFESCARRLGREVIHVERKAKRGWALDFGAIERAFESGARVFCVTDLHNPTGVALSDADVETLRSFAEGFGAWIVVDEVYRDFRPGPVGTSYVPGGRVVATSSLTKCYGLGGLRAGFLFAPPEIVERAERIEEIVYGLPPTVTVSLAACALDRADALLERGRAAAAAGRAVIDAWIATTPHVSWVPPDAGISGLVRVEGLTDSMRFADRLREELDVEVVPGALYGVEGHVRLSFGTPVRQLQASLDVLALGIPPLRA